MFDLTHTIKTGIPSWHRTIHQIIADELTFDECTTQTKFHAQRLIEVPCGIGTHIDSPAHCIKNGISVDQIPLTQLQTHYRLFDIVHLRDDYAIDMNDITSYEKNYGNLEKNEWLLINTGWHKRWLQSELYQNNYHFPHLTAAAAEYLATKELAGVGIDTLSVDTGFHDFPAHQILLSKNILILENVNFASSVMPTSGTVIIAPLLIKGATEAPCRVFIL